MRKKTAIVVDDSKSARFALRKSLEASNFSVSAVECAKDCYALLAQSKPDVIFMDHVMPDTDGFTALRHIRADKNSADVAVIICSSHDTPEFIAEARALGATDVLVKPADAEQLDRVLKNLEARAAAETHTLASTGQRVMAAIRSTLTHPPRKDAASDISAQIAELRAQASHLEQKLAQEHEAAAANMDQQTAIQQLRRRMDALEQRVESRFNELQIALESGFRQQAERVAKFADVTQKTAIESAHIEAERTILQAASHISDQFVSSLITALRAGSFKPLLQPTPAKPSPPETAFRQKA